jgi:hypothetical protein
LLEFQDPQSWYSADCLLGAMPVKGSKYRARISSCSPRITSSGGIADKCSMIIVGKLYIVKLVWRGNLGKFARATS